MTTQSKPRRFPRPTPEQVRELRAILDGLARSGWERVCSVMDDCGTGGIYFIRGEQRPFEHFKLHKDNHPEARKLAGLDS